MSNNNPVYYFSGTGGCLAAARRISEELPGFSPVPIASLQGESSITTDAEAVGLVFPLYYAGSPAVVADFMNKLSFTRLCYVFAVVACGFPWSGYALHQLNGLLKKKGQKLSAGFYLAMTDNFLPHYDVPSPEKQEEIYSACDKKLGLILGHVKRRDSLVEREKGLLMYSWYPRFVRQLKSYDKHFWTDTNCNACGLCGKVCPVRNIALQDGKPVWQHRCEFCMACISYCPKKAIQWKKVTQKKGRYHCKGVSAADISAQREK
jgi:ferredoxin